jgi:ATP-dependent protease ClpP protease subunit
MRMRFMGKVVKDGVVLDKISSLICFWPFDGKLHTLPLGLMPRHESERMNDKTDSNLGFGKPSAPVVRPQRPVPPVVFSSKPSTGLLTSSVRERRAPLRGPVTKQNASCCIARLLVLAAENPRQPIVVYIDSTGGAAGELLGIVSTMNGIRCPIVTFCRGQVGGPATVIAAHGLRGYRAATSNARFSFKTFDFVDRWGHKASKESFLELMADILAKDARRQKAEVLDWLTKGIEFGPQEAIQMGLIDKISAQPLLPDVL